MPNGMKVFGGRANTKLTDDICAALGIPVGKRTIKQFADGELWMQYDENIRGADVFIVQPTGAPANDTLMELLLMCQTAKLASAQSVTAVMPYYGYARQDRKDRPRTPLTAKLVASLLETQNIARLLTMDLHSAPIQGFFDIPVDHLYALPIFIDTVKANFNLQNLTIVTPDTGGTARARLLSSKLGLPLAIIDKHREAANVSEVMNVIGDVAGRDCLMIDDIIDTAGTLVKGAQALMERGAKSVSAIATHGVLSYDHKLDISAIDKIEQSPLQHVFVADTINQEKNLTRVLRNNVGDDSVRTTSKLQVFGVGKLFAAAISAVYNNESVSGLFV